MAKFSQFLFLVSSLPRFIVESKLEYSLLCGHTRLLSLLYLGCNLAVSLVKIYLTSYLIISDGEYPSFAKTPLPGSTIVPGQIIDYIWMVFNSLLPAGFAFVRSRVERPLEIVIDFKPHQREVGRQQKRQVPGGKGKVWQDKPIV